MISPYFVCLSMIVSGRAWHDHPNLTALDCLAYAIDREGDETPLPPLVERALPIFAGPGRRQGGSSE